jgi:exopolyphosphatase / guanosine-5'-triphosphate,3'-diphosphate pyrophosphatase
MNRIAVIAIGSNSIRMLAADANFNLTNSFRARKESRLFMALESGLFPDAALRETAEAVSALKATALRQGADHIDLIATSAVRDAGNSRLLSHLLQAETGLKLIILSGREEAVYSFRGAAGAGLSGVVDIGGGSTEIVVGEGLRIFAAVSAQAGASRLYREQPIHSESDIGAAMAVARSQLEEPAAALMSAPRPQCWYVTGGTGTTMAAVIQKLPLENAMPEGFSATRQDVFHILRLVAALPARERNGIVGLPNTRTDIFPTGLCLLLTVMDLLNIERISVTTRGNTDGWLRSTLSNNFLV